jgi:hypothetical protein
VLDAKSTLAIKTMEWRALSFVAWSFSIGHDKTRTFSARVILADCGWMFAAHEAERFGTCLFIWTLLLVVKEDEGCLIRLTGFVWRNHNKTAACALFFQAASLPEVPLS